MMGAVNKRMRVARDAVRRPRHDLAVPWDLAETATATERWIRSVVGADAVLSIARPDRAGRLRLVWRGFDPSGPSDAVGAARRRAAFRQRRAGTIDVGGSGRALATLPLVARGDPVGILEVEALRTAIERDWAGLEAIADLLALQIADQTRNAALRRDLDTMRQASSLGSVLARARTPDEAVREAVRFLSEVFDVPIAAWWIDGEARMSLAEARGLGPARVREVRQALPVLAPWATLGELERQEAKRRFAKIVAARRVEAIDAGSALLLFPDPGERLDGVFDVVQTILADVLRLLTVRIDAEERLEQLEMGLAWTAHEQRGPILGVRAALEVLLSRVQRATDLRLLRRSLAELEQLAETAEVLMDLAAGNGKPVTRPTDLVALVQEAITSVSLETGEDRVVLLAPDRAVARVDPRYLRPAIVNLIRNGLSYSETGTKVEVTIKAHDDAVSMSVTNAGPGIPFEERKAIFAPFVRGSATDGATPGRGLGLFIAQRAVLAHGGRIWVDSEESGGITFQVDLPVGGREWERFAS